LRATWTRAAEVADLYILVHRDYGPISTFLTRADAEDELARVFGDEPTWVGTMSVEPFELVEEDGD
jgi:hypothetical protein